MFARWRRSLTWPSLALLIVNVAIAWPLFHVAYLSFTGSGEPVQLAYARYAREHFPDLSWCTFWYNGIPFQNAYPPGLYLAADAVSYMAHIAVPLAFHIVVAAMYSLGPVTLFLLACRLTRARGWSFCAALLYSLFSPSAWLVPAIHHDLGSLFWAQRLHTPVFYADSPQIAALTLIPLAILALDFALEHLTPASYVGAALALAAVPLTNWPGAITLAFAVLAYGLTHRNWLRIIGTAALAYAFAIPWIPPSTILTTQADTQAFEPVNHFGARHLIYAAALILCVWIVLRVTRRLAPWFRFFILFLFFTAAVTLGYYWLGITLLAQPWRFHLAMEMAFVLMLVFTVRPVLARWQRPAVVIFALFCVFQFVEYRAYARRLIHPIDITQTSEYKTARWFDAHMREDRVMVPGSSTYWLNVFTDTPQLSGCCPQGVLNQIARIADYGITTDLTAENRAFDNSLLWFKALGIRAVAVSGPRSTEFYKPFYHPHKFDGRLPELWRNGDDVIFEVPWQHYSLAHAVEPADLPPRTPIHGVDSEPLKPYVEAIDRPDAPPLHMRWLNDENVVISGHLRPGQIVSVQENYHPGWHASLNGSPRRIYPDKLGFMVVVPECTVDCTIRLHYDGGNEMRAASLINSTALMLSLIWIALPRRHQRA